MEKLNNSVNASPEWDMSDAPEFADAGSMEAEVKAPNSLEAMKFWCQEYNTAEAQFVRYSKTISGRPLSEAEYGHYRKTVAKYESDVAYDWQRIEETSNQALSDQLIHRLNELADAQSLGIVKPEETIEAATGIFYEERMEALNQQILSREQNKDTTADQAVLRQTWRKVMDYIEASTDYDFLHRDYSAYQNARRTCHNNMIQQLNHLNLLAEKYGTVRFTPRNFMTNDFAYSQRRDRGGKLNNRANYDRETVLAYFRTVFEGDFSAMERKSAYNSRDLRAGMTYYD